MSHILISGASRGIGKSICEAFVDSGDKITLLYNTHPIDIASYNTTNIQAYKCDVSDPSMVSSTICAATSSFGDIDVLISCAGISRSGLAQDFSFDDYHQMMDINFGGLFNLVKEATPSMVRNQKGVIIAISSMWGQVGASCEALYSASKSAIDGYIKSLAKELGPSNIRVNAVSPGVIMTDMLSVYSEEDLNSLANETPLQRLGKPEDIANVVKFLCSEDASFITGQIIGVNGGFLI